MVSGRSCPGRPGTADGSAAMGAPSFRLRWGWNLDADATDGKTGDRGGHRSCLGSVRRVVRACRAGQILPTPAPADTVDFTVHGDCTV
ncbi:hypothetical protein GCM10010129_02460 [Streptomyces fumigatiscleroticus]|nr:hypothetical protein GCM10010129_02460 [Streptomyces fumigatiscleroticus]